MPRMSRACLANSPDLSLIWEGGQETCESECVSLNGRVVTQLCALHCPDHVQPPACTTAHHALPFSCSEVIKSICCLQTPLCSPQTTLLLLWSGGSGHMPHEPAGGTTAAGLSSNSPRSESSDDFADAQSQGHHSSRSSSATAASFQTAPSAPVDNSSESEEEVRRSSRGSRRRGAGLAGVLGSPSPPRQSRFARFVSSAAAVTGLNAGSSTAQQEEGLAREKASRLGGTDGGQSELTQATAGEISVTTV